MKNDRSSAIVQSVVNNTSDAHKSARLMAQFSSERVMPGLYTYCGISPLSETVIGLVQRVDFWLHLLAKLDSIWDFQTVMNAARSVYEMHIDIRILCIN